MIRLTHLTVFAVALAGVASPIAHRADGPSPDARDDQGSSGRACAARAAGDYGFQCHGSAFTGSVHEPVTFIGTVSGTEAGFYEGYGTFNSSGGSAPSHVAGQATFGRSCMGRVDYTTNEILLPGGGTVPLPPVSFEFISVDGGNEILGTGVANPPNATGDFVPRLTCRLVRTGR